MRFLKFIVVFILFSSTVFSQKNIDLKLLNVYEDSTHLISDTIYNPLGFAIPYVYYIKFTNQDSTSIAENDTLLLHYYVNGQKQIFDNQVYPPTDSFPYTGIDLQPNDTMLLRVYVFNNYRKYIENNSEIIEECFELVPSSVSLYLNELTPSDNIMCYDRCVYLEGLSTESEKTIEPLLISPNPTSGYIYFNSPVTQFQIYSSSGQNVRDYTQVNSLKIDVSRLEKGVYFILGKLNGLDFTRKIILK